VTAPSSIHRRSALAKPAGARYGRSQRRSEWCAKRALPPVSAVRDVGAPPRLSTPGEGSLPPVSKP